MMKIPIFSKFMKAKAISKKAKAERDSKIAEVEDRKQEAHDSMESLGRAKLAVADGNLRRFIRQFQRITNIELMPEEKSEIPEVELESVTELQQTKFEPIDNLKVALMAGGAGAAGAASGAVAFGAIGSFASASTGTAIATLHGAAATNATLAFLGGGPVAAGGLGIAGGVAVLGGLVAVPAMVVGGVFLNKKADQALQTARQDARLVKKFVTESDKAIAILKEIKSGSSTLKNNLVELDLRFAPFIDRFKQLIDEYTYGGFFKRIYYASKRFLLQVLNKLKLPPPEWFVVDAKVSFTSFSKADQERVREIIHIAQVIKAIIDISVIDDAGVVPPSVGETIALSEKALSRMVEIG
jgi:hypothetical protein